MNSLFRLLPLTLPVVIALPLFPPMLQAEIPGAGVFQQQMERERGEVKLPDKAAPLQALPQPMKEIPGLTVTVHAFQFKGNSQLSAEQLAPVVSEYLNRPISFNELQQAAAAVAHAYHEAGWVVRAYLPQQDITEGTVIIQVIEAVFGGAELEGAPATRVFLADKLAAIDAALAKGELLNLDQLERSLLLLDDLSGVKVVGSLKKGVGHNETKLGVQAINEPLVSGEVSGDNFGARATGAERVTTNLHINSPLGIGDHLEANFSHSRGADYGRLDYSLPVGNDGWRVGGSASYLGYELVGSDFAGLDGNGNSSTVGLNASYPLIRSRLKNLYLGLNYDHKYFYNQANQAITSLYQIDDFAVGLNGNLFDKLGGGGINQVGLTLTQGILDQHNINLSENPRLDGGFTKVNYYLNRQQALSENLSLFAQFYGQAASGNLNFAEKFYLGGPYGVRAYPVNEAGGDEAQAVTVELRGQLPYNLTLTGFYDMGHIRVNRDNVNQVRPNSYVLEGAGLTLAWHTVHDLKFKATWTHRIGDNPNPAANGQDQDGSKQDDRFWLSASLPFEY